MMYLIFFITALFILFIASILAPVGVRINTEFYKAGEKILIQSNDSIQGIQDTEVRAQLTNTINSAISSAENNIEVNANLFQYSWVLVVLLAGIVLFIQTRQMVEFGNQGLS